MSGETHGSDGFRTDFLHYERGKFILYIYNFWVCIHASGFMKVNRWYHPKTAKLDKVLRPSHNKRLIKEDMGGRQRF